VQFTAANDPRNPPAANEIVGDVDCKSGEISPDCWGPLSMLERNMPGAEKTTVAESLTAEHRTDLGNAGQP
jgi:hypothetical protein